MVHFLNSPLSLYPIPFVITPFPSSSLDFLTPHPLSALSFTLWFASAHLAFQFPDCLALLLGFRPPLCLFCSSSMTSAPYFRLLTPFEKFGVFQGPRAKLFSSQTTSEEEGSGYRHYSSNLDCAAMQHSSPRPPGLNPFPLRCTNRIRQPPSTSCSSLTHMLNLVGIWTNSGLPRDWFPIHPYSFTSCASPRLSFVFCGPLYSSTHF